ncbi:MAG: glycosyltransferase 87 family protein [Candidatus Sulfotelmatobacter sp.]
MKLWFWLLLSMLVSGITSLYMYRVLEPWNDYIGAHGGGLKAQLWDLYPRWVGTRELFLHGRNPYSPEVSHEIQMAYYGHILTQDYRDTGHKIIDEQRFAYPVYIVFLMAPLINVDFAKVQHWAPAALALLAALIVPLSLDILRWRLPWTVLAAITLFTISSPQIVQGMHHQQLSIVVGLCLVAGAWCVSRNYLFCAGAVLAWSTIKPQMALFPLCFFLVWVLGNWPKRWKLLASFLAALTLLMGAGEIVLPGWIGYFLEGASAYRRYFPTTSLLRMALGDSAGEILGGFILAALLFLAWRNRKEPADSPQFTNVFAAFLIGTVLVFPLFTPFNQVLLILPAMLILQDWKALPKLAHIAFIAFVSWPWIISSLLLIVPPQFDPPNERPLLPLLLVSFFPLLLPVLLLTRQSHLIAPQALTVDSHVS